ncbi:hypothetical protein PHYC_02630 [Phycisphaerales bacterium]|nr:hypothetical protein PHYC_02630 [Phycisphaerales bacterium]
MGGFGRFEVVEELASSGPFTLYSARAAGETGAPKFAIRTFRTQDDFADAEIIERQAAAFLSGASLQASLAKAASANWAPIHHQGRTETHAFYVTDLYPMTGQKLVDSRRDLSARALAGIIAGVADALAVIQREHGGRGHGAIRPGNVLIRPRDLESGELDDAVVHVADPVAPERVEKTSAADDLRELAGLLHQLVVHRPSPRGGAIERSEDWTNLGGPGEALRHLCEQLLNPHPGAPLMTAVEIRATLDAALRIKTPSKGPNKALIGAIVALVLIGGGAGAYFAFSGGPKPIREDQDGRLRYVEAPAQWALDDESKAQVLLDGVDRARATGAGTPEDDAERERLAAQLSTLRQEVAELRGGTFPTGQTPDTPQRQKEFNAKIAKAEKDLSDTAIALDALKRRLPEIKEGQDPRVPHPMQWMSGQEKRLRDTFAAASADLKEAAGAKPEAAESLRGLSAEFERVTAEIAAVRGLVWDPPEPSGENGQPASADVLAAAAREKLATRGEIGQRVPKIVGETTRIITECSRAADRSREWLAEYLEGQRDRSKQVAASYELGNAFSAGMGLLIKKANRKELGWAGAGSEITKLENWVRGLEAAIPDMPAVAVQPGSTVDLELVKEKFREAREKAFQQIVAPLIDEGAMPDENAAAYKALVATKKAEIAKRGEDGKTLVLAATEIEDLLSRAFPTGEEGPAKRSIATLKGQVERLSRDTPAERAVARVLERVNELEKVEALSDVSSLVNAIAEAGAAGEPARAAGAWKKLLSTGYPARADQLETMARIANESLAPALDRVSDSARKSALINAARNDVREAWFTFVHERAGGVPSEVSKAFDSMGAAGVKEADLGRLEPWAKFNYERWRLLDLVQKGVTKTDKEGQIEQIKGLIGPFIPRMDSEFASLAAVGGMPGLRKQLGDFAAGKVVDLREEGPARCGWKGVPAADGSEVTYTWNNHTLRFMKVLEDAEKASFLCTTEVSLGLFVDVVETSGGWSTLPRQMGPKPAEANDGRQGPVVWRWWTADGGRMEPNPPSRESNPKSANGNGWFTNPPQRMVDAGYYPDAMRAPSGPPDPPSLQSPMNYVAPQAAAFMAAWTGCRLPTPAEWARAREMEGPSAAADSNRRDELWVQQHTYISGLVQQVINNGRPYNGARFPNGDIVRARAAGERPPAAEQDSAPAVPGNDGWLWFRPVGDGGGKDFHHIEGNVSEWVFAKPEALDPLLKPTMAAASDAIGRTGEGLAVIGASALSPAEYAPEVLLSCAPGQGQKGFALGNAAPGFADVGLRLAFTTGAGGGAGTPKDRLAAILRDTPYLAK